MPLQHLRHSLGQRPSPGRTPRRTPQQKQHRAEAREHQQWPAQTPVPAQAAAMECAQTPAQNTAPRRPRAACWLLHPGRITTEATAGLRQLWRRPYSTKPSRRGAPAATAALVVLCTEIAYKHGHATPATD
ncbi:MAG: hypothetical protein ACPGUV_06845 [Polyangiales bacterium]